MGIFSRLTGTDKFGVAQSALIAKYMYTRMTETDRNELNRKAIDVLVYGGYPPDSAADRMSRLQDTERYCLYSMTMAMAGIPPALKGILYNDQWYPIPNPFSALANADKQLIAASHEIRTKHGIELTL